MVDMKGVSILAKKFLLDTGIIVGDPRSILNFDEHDVYITEDTLIELNERRGMPGEHGAHIREALKLISEFYTRDSRQLPGGGKLNIIMRSKYARKQGSGHNSPLINALRWLIDNPELNDLHASSGDYILISNDSGNRIWASEAGLRVEPYRHEQVSTPPEQYKGRCELYASSDAVDALHASHELPASEVDLNGYKLTENEFVILKDVCNSSHTALAIHRNGILRLIPPSTRPYGVTPRKVGQQFALYALMAPVDEIPLVILKGPAGTAKTFLSLAAGLQQAVNDSTYDRILVSRPNIKFDNDIGYLKGSEEEKIGPLIRPVVDNLELLCRTTEPVKRGPMNLNNYVQDLFNQGKVVAQAMAYMRGRSVANTYILIDEAQNTTQAQAFGIVSRVGAGSKVVLAGDPEQIDTPELDTRNNGLIYTSEKMRGSSLCAQITFEPEECVRSPLALESITRMSQPRP